MAVAAIVIDRLQLLPVNNFVIVQVAAHEADVHILELKEVAQGVTVDSVVLPLAELFAWYLVVVHRRRVGALGAATLPVAV